MADMKTTYSTQNGHAVAGFKGANAGKSYETDADAQAKEQEGKDWNDFATSLSLSPGMFSGIAGASNKAKYKTQFDQWRGAGKAKTGGTVGDLLQASITRG